MTRSTTMTAAGAALITTAGLAFAKAIDALNDGQHGTWRAACVVAGCAATYGIYQLGRAHEAARHERNRR